MNVETANRLVQLRKTRGFSQEELAEKLGISRQAVSKWERAEASPDTDNLITLARLYGISLDELLGHVPTAAEPGEDEVWPDAGGKGDGRQETEQETPAPDEDGTTGTEQQGIHVGWDGSLDIPVNWNRDIPFILLVTAAYLIMGFLWNLWHPGWIVFLLIPLFSSVVEAIRHREMHRFEFPLLVTVVYLVMGFVRGLWHPGWIVFLTIPLYEALFPDKSGEESAQEPEDV